MEGVGADGVACLGGFTVVAVISGNSGTILFPRRVHVPIDTCAFKGVHGSHIASGIKFILYRYMDP